MSIFVQTTYTIAVDPGKVTGWAKRTPEGQFASGQEDCWLYLRRLHEALIKHGKQAPSAIVCEDFIYTTETAKKTRQTWSTESIGVLRLICLLRGIPFVLQTPVSAKKFSTDDKLKAMGWYFPSKGGHQNDAARHLLLHEVKEGNIDASKLLSQLERN